MNNNMMNTWRVTFVDLYSSWLETRSIVVEALEEHDAEELAEKEADRLEWPRGFKIDSAELIED